MYKRILPALFLLSACNNTIVINVPDSKIISSSQKMATNSIEITNATPSYIIRNNSSEIKIGDKARILIPEKLGMSLSIMQEIGTITNISPDKTNNLIYYEASYNKFGDTFWFTDNDFQNGYVNVYSL